MGNRGLQWRAKGSPLQILPECGGACAVNLSERVGKIAGRAELELFADFQNAQLGIAERNQGIHHIAFGFTDSDYPEFKYIGQHPYTIDYGYYHGYTKLDKEGKTAAYPFGFGLSYTTFEVSGTRVSENEKGLTVTATVKNTGKVAGAEVLQVYVGSKGAANGDDQPVKQLKGFRRVELNPGEEKTLEIAVSGEELKFWTPNGWVLDDAYTVYGGTNWANAAAV